MSGEKKVKIMKQKYNIIIIIITTKVKQGESIGFKNWGVGYGAAL